MVNLRAIAQLSGVSPASTENDVRSALQRRLLSRDAQWSTFFRDFRASVPRRKLVRLVTLPVRTWAGYGAAGMLGTVVAFSASPVAVPLVFKGLAVVAVGVASSAGGTVVGTLRSLDYLLFDMDLAGKALIRCFGDKRLDAETSIDDAVALFNLAADVLQGPAFLPRLLRPLWRLLVNSVFPLSKIKERLADFVADANKKQSAKLADLGLIFLSSEFQFHASAYIGKVRQAVLALAVALIGCTVGCAEVAARVCGGSKEKEE